MRRLRECAAIRTACTESASAGRLGLVPTMGAIHAGHLSLVERARAECDTVAVTIFVNPLQFDEEADFERYPRDEQRDAALLEEAGTDLLLLPSHDELYPPGFATRVVQDAALTEVLEGEARPGHFTGMLTVVAKLLALTTPQRAYFGRKDYQQATLVRRMAADLDLPAGIVVCETVRERDGLALSSRNVFLSTDERARGLGLVQALCEAQQAFEAGPCDAASLVASMTGQLQRCAVGPPDYVAVVDPDTLTPRQGLARPGDVALLAARLGATRLIDNHVLGDRIGPFAQGP